MNRRRFAKLLSLALSIVCFIKVFHIILTNNPPIWLAEYTVYLVWALGFASMYIVMEAFEKIEKKIEKILDEKEVVKSGRSG